MPRNRFLRFGLGIAPITVKSPIKLSKGENIMPSKKAKTSKRLKGAKPLKQVKPLTGGAGAGKVTFNPFSITRKIDISSPS